MPREDRGSRGLRSHRRAAPLPTAGAYLYKFTRANCPQAPLCGPPQSGLDEHSAIGATATEPRVVHNTGPAGDPLHLDRLRPRAASSWRRRLAIPLFGSMAINIVDT